MKIKMTYYKQVRSIPFICFVFGSHFNSFMYNYYASDKENNKSNFRFKSFVRRMKCES